MYVIQKQLYYMLKNKFIQEYRPFKVWNALKKTFDNLRTIL